MTATAFAEPTSTTAPTRTITVLAAPYDEISFMTPNPNGERIVRGAFAKSIAQPERVFLFRGHDHAHPIGRAVSIWEGSEGLYATFRVREGQLGDETLTDVREGFLPAASVGFRPIRSRRGARGETELLEGDLREVSLLPIGAYDSARVLDTRRADDRPARAPQPSHVVTTGRGRLATISLR